MRAGHVVEAAEVDSVDGRKGQHACIGACRVVRAAASRSASGLRVTRDSSGRRGTVATTVRGAGGGKRKRARRRRTRGGRWRRRYSDARSLTGESICGVACGAGAASPTVSVIIVSRVAVLVDRARLDWQSTHWRGNLLKVPIHAARAGAGRQVPTKCASTSSRQRALGTVAGSPDSRVSPHVGGEGGAARRNRTIA